MADDNNNNHQHNNPAGMVTCQCRRIHHYRNPCHNPARPCNWCKDGGCAVQRQNEQRQIRRTARAERGHGSSHHHASPWGGGAGGPLPAFGMPMMRPLPFLLGGPWFIPFGYEDVDDEDDDDSSSGPY